MAFLAVAGMAREKTAILDFIKVGAETRIMHGTNAIITKE